MHHGLDPSLPHAPLSLHRWGLDSKTQSNPELCVSLWQRISGLSTFVPVPPTMSVYISRFPLPTCAGSAVLPQCIAGSVRETHLHPEQRLQCW